MLVPQPRSLSPDRLSQFPFATTGPEPGKLETYRERHAISDGNQSIISYHVEGLNHAGDMAIVYLPKAKILINADMGPPAAGMPVANVSPKSVALYNNIKRLKRTVGRDQWMPLAAGVDFESRLLLRALRRFLLSIASASNGNKKPARSSLLIASRSREE
jgi:hypothetical protein